MTRSQAGQAALGGTRYMGTSGLPPNRRQFWVEIKRLANKQILNSVSPFRSLSRKQVTARNSENIGAPAEPGQFRTPRWARFGSFEADFREGRLTKNGRRIRLQRQPFQILALLLERPGQLVTREEMRQKLWPQSVFVSFDAALNTAVGKLRDALSDSADDPKFLETVPRQGYRLVAPVAWSFEPPAVVPSTSRVGRHPYLLVVAALTLAGSAILTVWHFRGHGDPITPEDTIVLADFDNSTGEEIFDGTLNTALNLSLRQSPFFKVLPDSDVARTLQQMTRPPGTRLGSGVARELCQRARSKAYLVGAIGRLGSKYVLELKAVNCQNGDTLAQEQAIAASKEKVLDALGEAASRLRSELGESLASVQKFDVPLAHATTSSLDALKAYSLAVKVFRETGPAAALPHDQDAVRLDPNFAIAYLAVGDDYYAVGEMERAKEYFTKAFELRERVSEWERLAITADHYMNVTGELDKAAATYEQWIESYPRDDAAYETLGVVYALQGQYEKATEITNRAMLMTTSFGAYGNLPDYELALQRFDEARRITSEAQARKMDGLQFRCALYALAFLHADSAAMAEQQEWFVGKPVETVGLALASDTEAYRGHLGKARELTKRAVDSAIQTDNKESGAIWLANAALEQAAYGKTADARQTAVEALKLAPTSTGVEAEVALALAMTRDTARAESLARDLQRRFPLGTQMQSLWLSAIQTQLALDRNSPAYVLSAPGAAPPLEFGTIPFTLSISCLYPTYVRGEAYLAAGQGGPAAAEFQKILDHSGLVWNCWTGALAHLGLARANALQARTSQGADAAARERALAAYKDFLTLWKDADPDIPILKQARTEYARFVSTQ